MGTCASESFPSDGRRVARPYRVAVLGCGRIGGRNDSLRRWTPGCPPLSHAGAYRTTEGVLLVAAADRDDGRLEEFGRFWNVRALYRDAGELLEREAVDIVSICTPTQTHAPLIEEAARRGVRAIFCEKPLALDLSEGMRALAVSAERGTVVQVHYGRRWVGALGKLADELHRGEWGIIRRVSAYYPGGVVGNGTHAIDLIRWMVGDLESVRALTPAGGDDPDPQLDAWCRTKSDAPCLLQSCDPGAYSLLEIDILADRGRIRVTGNGRRIERVRAVADAHFPGYRLLAPEGEARDTDWETSLSRSVSDLIACIETGQRPRCGGAEAIEALRVAEAIRLSAREGCREVLLGPVATDLPAGGRNRS